MISRAGNANEESSAVMKQNGIAERSSDCALHRAARRAKLERRQGRGPDDDKKSRYVRVR